MLVQPDKVEESRTLVPQQVMDTVLIVLIQPVQLFDGSHIFVHASQYHWHDEGMGDMRAIDQEAREHIVSIAELLDCFGHQTKQTEEFLWAHAEQAATGNQAVRLVEPLDERISKLE